MITNEEIKMLKKTCRMMWIGADGAKSEMLILMNLKTGAGVVATSKTPNYVGGEFTLPSADIENYVSIHTHPDAVKTFPNPSKGDLMSYGQLYKIGIKYHLIAGKIGMIIVSKEGIKQVKY